MKLVNTNDSRVMVRWPDIFLLSALFREQKGYEIFTLQSRRGDTGPISSFFLVILLLLTMAAFSINGFQGRRSLGILMIMIYLTYLLFCILSELEIMHPFGTGHAHGDILDEDD